MNTPKPSHPFYVGYSQELPDKDRRFLLKAIPASVLTLGGVSAALGTRAASGGGGRWETGTPITLTGRVGFHPHPILWVNGEGIVLAGIGKTGTDAYVRAYVGQTVQMTGVRIIRGGCSLLGVAAKDITPVQQDLPPLPQAVPQGRIAVMGEILDAQCYMGIMNPGYGHTHRGCAVQCVRGGQPVFFSVGKPGVNHAAQTACGDIGFLLAGASGEKINLDILPHIARPLTLEADRETLGNLTRLRLDPQSLRYV